MPAPRKWTAEEDELIRTMRVAGKTFREISALLGCIEYTARTRAYKISANYAALKKSHAVQIDDKPAPWSGNGYRAPMAAGSPVSWGVITAGTCLEGAEYPPYVPLIFRRELAHV